MWQPATTLMADQDQYFEYESDDKSWTTDMTHYFSFFLNSSSTVRINGTDTDQSI